MANVSELFSTKKQSKQTVKKCVNKGKAKIISKHKIPQCKLEEALKVLKDEEQLNLLFKQSASCGPPIHLAAAVDTQYSAMMLLFEDMRTCLLQRDWRSLAELLLAADPRADSHRGLNLGLIVKYVSILTAYNDRNLMELLAQSVLQENNAENILHTNTKFPKTTTK